MGRTDRFPRGLLCETYLPEVCPPADRSQEISVNILKQLGLTFVQMAKQVYLLPQTIANISKQRRLQVILDAREAERLDRIRHPDKYRGK